jgi:hypothetical protein
MTVNDLQNVTYESIGNPVVCYRITANEGYCIHLPTHEENSYARIIVVPASYDFSTIQVLPISELPEGAEIHGGETGPETETI